jgi:transcriptional repressor NrdR
MVIKKDGKKEPFNIDKLKKGVALALEKRPFNEEDVSIIASSIEKELKKLRNHVINTRIIGNKVIRKLKLLDQVAYLRFASIYKDFEKIDDFEEELKILTK